MHEDGSAPKSPCTLVDFFVAYCEFELLTRSDSDSITCLLWIEHHTVNVDVAVLCALCAFAPLLTFTRFTYARNLK
jgi:hypothetical protein